MRASRLIAATGRYPALKPVRRAALAGVRLTYATSRPRLVVRSELPALLNRRGLTGTAVEIGVKRGEFSEFILQRWKGKMLVSVDPWMAAPEDEYNDTSNVEQGAHDGFYEQTCRRLERFGARSKIWRTTSQEAAMRVDNRSLDFIYLDARHDYDSVREDLEAWSPKLKPGGVIAGHDYLNGQIAQGNFGVKRAVDEFFDGESILVTQSDAPWPSWVVLT
jgi:hypothetical protein